MRMLQERIRQLQEEAKGNPLGEAFFRLGIPPGGPAVAGQEQQGAGIPFGRQAAEAFFRNRMTPPGSDVAGQEQQGAGILFGPGRAMRVPPAGSSEYQQMMDFFRRG